MIITDTEGQLITVNTGLLKGLTKEKLIEILQTQIEGNPILVCNTVGNLAVMDDEDHWNYLGFVDFGTDEKYEPTI